MKRFDALFLPSERRGKVDQGTSIKEAAQILGVEIESICGGKGSCGKCKVRVLKGSEFGFISDINHVSPTTDVEQRYAQEFGLHSEERLACQAKVKGDIAVFVPEESRVRRQSIQKAAGKRSIEIAPSIRKYFLNLTPADINFSSDNPDPLLAEVETRFDLHDLYIDHQAQDELAIISKNNAKGITVTVWDDREMIWVEAGRHEKAYGLAIDIGTTTVGAYLCDLDTGEVLVTESMMNPQIQYGEDIMTRISHAKSNTGGLVELNKSILDALKDLISSIVNKVNLTSADIVETVVVGNTVMHHLFLGLDIAPLGLWPFKPDLYSSVNRKARDLGLEILPSANVHVLPIEAGFVGADNVGVLIAEEPYNQDDILLIIDIGTNGELVMGNRKRLLSASCATGPAFEGATIKFGMRAAKGAIDRVRIDPETLSVRFSVIGHDKWQTEMPPEEIKACGICGSGIIDAVAEMYISGLVKKDGGFDKLVNSKRLRLDKDEKPEFVIAWARETALNKDITVTQKDVRAIQLAKAAINSGAQMMLRRLNVERLDKVILAGAFGTVIDKERAFAIGMFPECDIEDVYSIGNAAGDGARIALLNKNKRQEADKIAREIEYIELTEAPGFHEAFIGATHFPSRIRRTSNKS